MRLSAKFVFGIFPQPSLSALELEKAPQSRRSNEKTHDREYDVGNSSITAVWIAHGPLSHSGSTWAGCVEGPVIQDALSTEPGDAPSPR